MFQSQSIIRINPLDCIVQSFNDKGGLYLGNIESAGNGNLLFQYKIGAILTIMSTQEYIYDGNISSMFIRADDVDFVNISQFFQQAIDFIDYNRQFTNVLVHCYAGISRSATIIIAYLMKTFRMSLDYSFSYVQAQRPIINPNIGFMKQLQQYEQHLQDLNAARYSSMLQNNIIRIQNTSTMNVHSEYQFQNTQPSQNLLNCSYYFGNICDLKKQQESQERNNNLNSQYPIVSQQCYNQTGIQGGQVLLSQSTKF